MAEYFDARVLFQQLGLLPIGVVRCACGVGDYQEPRAGIFTLEVVEFVLESRKHGKKRKKGSNSEATVSISSLRDETSAHSAKAMAHRRRQK